MFGQLYRLTHKAAKKRADELLERFDLTDAGNRMLKTYSGGMRRRLDLAASLIVAPPVIFLDEPTTGLDPRSRNGMWDVIQDLVNDGTTVLLTTQYLEEADQLADQIVVVDHGRVIAEGTATSSSRSSAASGWRSTSRRAPTWHWPSGRCCGLPAPSAETTAGSRSIVHIAPVDRGVRGRSARTWPKPSASSTLLASN